MPAPCPILSPVNMRSAQLAEARAALAAAEEEQARLRAEHDAAVASQSSQMRRLRALLVATGMTEAQIDAHLTEAADTGDESSGTAPTS